MSQAEIEGVRQPFTVRERSHRTLDQRLALRFPRLLAPLLRLVAKLPPRSRLRQAAMLRALRQGIEAYNRRDMAAVGIAYHPEFEYHPARNWVEAGLLEQCYRGLEGHKRYVASTAEVFGAEVYVMPVELIDAGERIAVLANVPMRAQASGIRLTEAFALVSTFEDGMVIRTQEFYDYAEALEAVGLSEQDAHADPPDA
jgi:ketosteroid isomerase-like protein